MRCPAFHLLLIAFLAVALAAGGVVASDAASPSTVSSDTTTMLTTSATTDDPVLTAGTAASPTVSSDHALGDPDSAVSDDHALDDSAPSSIQFDPRTETEMRIDLDSNRDAEWTVIVRYELTDANETAAFETVSDRFLDGDIGPNEARFENFAAGASEYTEREMAIEDAERTATVHDDPDAIDEMDVSDDAVAVGELRLTFTWTAFLEEDGENLVLGDALTTPTNGTWVRSLEDAQSIEVTPPNGYTVSGTPGATVTLRDNAVIIEGPRTFDADDRVEVVYSPTGVSGTEDTSWTLIVGGLIVAAVIIAGGLLGYRRYGGDGGAAPPDGSVPADGDSGVGTDAAAGSSTDPAAGDGAGSTAAAAGAAADTAPDPEEDLSLLSDEERVERLLDRNGGRMRQAAIVRETGWSDAKVSQLLSRMADEGRIEKLRLGRENLISLPDGTDGTDTGESEGAGDTGSGTV
ncbi:helix-turn-helix transcriptional regulator [Halorubrum vacuolatum]|uniref:Uncharacterized membrane protein n=1 Tax=Halorubrum vacuolatum TaxID=63740 RepID=A0A238VL04_HALVU|nr:hypothetical protein [Halorubrum vacuolatum]SNR34854.1 Uncharacterized membrane protein [Halorubrum vacuolatum]